MPEKKEKRQGDAIRKRANVRVWSCAGTAVDYVVTGLGCDVELTPIHVDK